jgi:hypothetical protein
VFDSCHRQEFSLLKVIQTGSGADPNPPYLGANVSFPKVQRTERECVHTFLSSNKAKN